LPVEPSVSSIASTSDAAPLPTVAQSVEPSIVLSQSSTSLNPIDPSAPTINPFSSADLPGLLSLPTAIVQITALGGNTSDVFAYTDSTTISDVLSSSYAYNVNPASNIVTQTDQLASLVSSGSNTQLSQNSAQQTSVDSNSQLTQATSSIGSVVLPTMTSSSYGQETISVDGSVSPSSQPDTDESATSSPSLSETSSTIETLSEATVTQSPEQAASTSDTYLASTTSVLYIQSTPTSPYTSSNTELDQDQTTSTSTTDLNSNGGSSTTGEDTLIAPTASLVPQETVSATLGLSLSALLSSDSISFTTTDIEATVVPSEPTSLFTQSTLAGVETISDSATYSIASPSLAGSDPTSTDPVLVSASTDDVLDSAPTSVTSPDLEAPTSSISINLSNGEAAPTITPIPVISLPDQLSLSEASTSQDVLSSSVPIVGPALNLLSTETSPVILPLETSNGAAQTSSVDDSAESLVNSNILPSITTDIIPSETDVLPYGSLATSDIGSISSDILASTTFELIDLPTQVLATEAAASSTYPIYVGDTPTTATEIEFPSTSLPVDPEAVASDTEIALPAAETQAALPTTSPGSIDSLLSSIVSDTQTVDVAQPSRMAVESSNLSGEDQAFAPLSVEVSIPTESIPDTDFVPATISEVVVPSSDVQAITSGVPLDITTTVPDLYTDASETSVLIPTSVSTNQQVPDITPSVDELTTALPGSSVDNLLASLTSLVSQELPTSTYIRDSSAISSIAEDLTTGLPDSNVDTLLSTLTSLASEDLPTSALVDDVPATVVSDLPAAASSIFSDLNDSPAAVSSIFSQALPSDISQPAELVSSIVGDITTSLPAAAGSIIDGSVPTSTSDVGAAATSLVDNTDDLASSVVSDPPAAASSILSDFSDLPAAASSIVSETLPSDPSQPTELVSSIIDGITTDVPLATDLLAAASSTVEGSIPSITSYAGVSASSLVSGIDDAVSSIISSIDPVSSDDVLSITYVDGSLSITASVDEIPVTSAGIDPTQVTESLAQTTSLSGDLDLSTASATTLIDDTLTSSIPAVDVAESETTPVPTSVDLSAPSLVSGATASSNELPQQTDKTGSLPSYSVDPSGPATSEILPPIASDVSDASMVTSDLLPTTNTDLSVSASFEAITNTDLLSATESTAQVASFDISATSLTIAEPTYSEVDPITTGLDAAVTSTTFDADISTDLFGIEPTAAASLPTTNYGVSVEDGAVSTDLSASSTTLEAPNVVDPSATAGLSSWVESSVLQPVQSDLDTASNIIPSATSMVETLLTSAIDSVSSATDLGSETSIIENGSIPTQNAIIPSEALETSTTIAGGDGLISSLVNDFTTMTDASDQLSTPAVSNVLDGSRSPDVASASPISLGIAATSTVLEVPSSELVPTSSTLDEVMSSTASIDLSLTAAQSLSDLPTQTTDVSLSDSIPDDEPTDASQAEEVIPSSTSMYIPSISDSPDESLPTAIPESSEPIWTAIGVASTISEATATLVGDSSIYTDLVSSTQPSPTHIVDPETSSLVDLSVISDPDGATSMSNIPSLSVTNSIESIPTSAADLDQLSTTSLSDILSALPTEVETMGLSATAALSDPSTALTESMLSPSATLSDMESSLTEAIDSMTSALDASVTIPTTSSDMLVSTLALGAAQSGTLVSLPTSQSIEFTSIGSIETDVAAPSVVISSDTASSPATTDSPSLSTSSIDDLLSSSTDLADVTSILDAASPSTSVESVDPAPGLPSSDVAEVQTTTMPFVASDVSSPSATITDALSSLIETATSQIGTISSALDDDGITASSEVLASVTGTALLDSSSIETSTPDVLGEPITLLSSDSQSLPTSTLDFGVSVPGLPTDFATFTTPNDADSLLVTSSIIDDEPSAPTSILAQTTDISDISISADGLSEPSAPITTNIEASLDSSTSLPLVTDVPTITNSDPMALITSMPESSEINDPDTASLVPGASSTLESIMDSSSVDLGSLPTSEIVDVAGSLATSITQDASSAIAYVGSSTVDLGSLPTSDVVDATASPSTPSIVLDVSSATTTIDSSSVDLQSLSTSDVAEAAALPSITYSSDSLSAVSAPASTNSEATLDTPATSVVDDLPSSTISDFLSSITPAPDLPQTSLSSIIEDDSSAMPSLIDSSDDNYELQPTSALVDLPSSINSFDALSEAAASSTTSNEEVPQLTTIPSSTIDMSSITSLDPLPLATTTSETGEISSLDTASDILSPSSLAQTTVGSSAITLEPELTSALAETTDLPSGNSPVDSEIYLPTEVITQNTNSPSITSDPDIQSEALSSLGVTSVPITNESMNPSATSVLSNVVSEITDLPSSTISDLSALTTAAPESLETGSDLVDISPSTQDDSSLVSVASSSAIVVSGSAPTSAVSEVTDVASITLDLPSETSALPVTLSEGITNISTSSSATDVPLSIASASVPDSASSLMDSISASVVLGAAETSSSLFNPDMVTPTAILTQATDLSEIFTSSAAQSDIFTSLDPTTATALDNDATALPSSLVSSLTSEIISSVVTALASLESTSSSAEIGGVDTGIPSLSQDDASMVSSTPSQTRYSASAAADLPVTALSSSIDLSVNVSTSIVAEVSETIPLSSSLALSTILADPEPLSTGNAEDEAASTTISGLPTEIQTMEPSSTAALTDSLISSVVAIPSTLSQSLYPDSTETSSSLMSVVGSTSLTSATIQISADPELSIPTSLPTLSSVTAPLETSTSAAETYLSAVTLSSLDVSTETPGAVANMTSLSLASEVISAAASSLAATSQALPDATLASVDSTFAASAIQTLTSSSITDSLASSLLSSLTASSQSVSITEPSLSSATVLPVQTPFGAASSSPSGSSSTTVQISDIASQTTLGASFVAPTSSLNQISSAISLQSDDLISSILQALAVHEHLAILESTVHESTFLGYPVNVKHFTVIEHSEHSINVRNLAIVKHFANIEHFAVVEYSVQRHFGFTYRCCLCFIEHQPLDYQHFGRIECKHDRQLRNWNYGGLVDAYNCVKPSCFCNNVRIFCPAAEQLIESKCFNLCYDPRVIEHIRFNFQLLDHQHIFIDCEHTSGWDWQQSTWNDSDFVNLFKRYIDCGVIDSIARYLIESDSLDFQLGHLVVKHGFGQHSKFIHCYYLVVGLRFSCGSQCYKRAFHTSGVLRYV
ncbi:hypothetical protein KCU65_g8068, partial [Aureobasidium melanogenum]